MKKLGVIIFLISSLFIFASCKKGELPILLLEEEQLVMRVADVEEIKVTITGLTDYQISYLYEEIEVIEINEGSILALQEGEVLLTIRVKGLNQQNKETILEEVMSVTVLPKLLLFLSLSGAQEVIVGEVVTLEASKHDLVGEITWTSSDPMIATVENGIVSGISAGLVTITASCQGMIASLDINVYALDKEAPVFILGNNYQPKVILNWHKDFDVLSDISAVDNRDGEITKNIEIIKNFNNTEYGLQTVTLQISDEAGNTSTMSREVEVVWDYSVTFIGHAGSFYGAMNSEAAILYAIQVLKYQAVEIDLKQTADGVFILSHDDTFGSYTIANTNWATLKDVTVNVSRSSGFPQQNGSVINSPYPTKLCTLERFLQICKEYNVKAVIELKSSKGITNTDQSRMGALMQVIEGAGARENIIFLGSQYNCLIWTRNNGYRDIPCQYLVNSLESQTILDRCIENDLDISINVTGDYANGDEWLARYVEAGCKISTYTFTQYVNYDVVQLWLDKGVDFVTCDWQLMSKLKLPEEEKTPLATYEVIFRDYDDHLLKTSLVKEGRTAPSPQPIRSGYTFIGWDKDITKVSSNLEVKALYQINTYSITYNPNVDTIVESSWATKAAFIEEFYTDLYNWLLSNGKNISEITVNGSLVTMIKNGVTVSFSDVAGLKAIDIYHFEKTISNIIYKPVIRLSGDTCIIEASEDYFLNSSAYLVKYMDLDRWFVNCINISYPPYDKTYTPLSDGRIQIMFRFHQWQKGTSIAPFNTLPKKHLKIENPDISYILPTSNLVYTILDEFVLPKATGNKVFLGWFLDKDGNQEVTKISKGSIGNIVLYAKWGG